MRADAVRPGRKTKTEEAILRAAYYYVQAESHKETLLALKELHRAVIADIDAVSRPDGKGGKP